MHEPTIILILGNNADENEGDLPSVVACAALPVTAELVTRCRQRLEAAQAADVLDPSLAELCFRDPDGPQIYGDDLLEACARSSNEFHDDFCNHQMALLPAGINLEVFPATRVECRKTVIWLSFSADQAGMNITWAAVAVATTEPIRTEPVPLEYLEQLVASGKPPGCDCEALGYFCCGVPGILAHCEHGRLAADAVVERCDSCELYTSDAAALAELRRLGIA